MAEYYLLIANQVRGPFSEGELRGHLQDGMVKADSQVCTGFGEWERMAERFPAWYPGTAAATQKPPPLPVLGSVPAVPAPGVPGKVTRRLVLAGAPLATTAGATTTSAAATVRPLLRPPPPPEPNAVSRRISGPPPPAYVKLTDQPAEPPPGGRSPDGTYPGIGRLMYLGVTILISFLAVGIGSAVGGRGMVLIMALLPPVAMLVPGALRFQNIGRNPLWCLLGLVPVVSLFVTLPCLLAPAGYEHHRKLDLAAKICGGLILGILVMALVVMIYALTFGGW